MATEEMRERFVATATALVEADDRVALVLAQIGVAAFAPLAARHSRRVINVGIREQLMVSVAAGFALTGFRPIVHTIASFAVERPWEQLKVALGHQDAGAVIVAHGASYDYSTSGRTHHAPEDVALIDALPGWDIHVPGHPDEVEQLLRAAVTSGGRAYVRLAVSRNRAPHADGIVRRGGRRGLVIAVGPMLDRVLAATEGLDVSVVYFATVRPFAAELVRAAAASGDVVVVVEPYLEGTSTAAVARALEERPHRIIAIGVPKAEHRSYGSVEDLDRVHGLDVVSLRHRIERSLS